MRQNSSLDGPLKATRRLPEGCGGRQGITPSACEGLNPHRDRLGLPRGFVQPASIRNPPGTCEDSGRISWGGSRIYA